MLFTLRKKANAKTIFCLPSFYIHMYVCTLLTLLRINRRGILFRFPFFPLWITLCRNELTANRQCKRLCCVINSSKLSVTQRLSGIFAFRLAIFRCVQHLKSQFTAEIYYAIEITIRLKNGLCTHVCDCDCDCDSYSPQWKESQLQSRNKSQV